MIKLCKHANAQFRLTRVMKNHNIFSIACCFFTMFAISQAQADAEKGKEFFMDVEGGNCRTCHKTTAKKLIGPGLENLMLRHSEEWVKLFITDPQKTWEMDHPETIDLKKRVRGMKMQYARCRKAPMAEETKDDLIDFFKTLSVQE